jgi:hypothetical protein
MAHTESYAIQKRQSSPKQLLQSHPTTIADATFPKLEMQLTSSPEIALSFPVGKGPGDDFTKPSK